MPKIICCAIEFETGQGRIQDSVGRGPPKNGGGDGSTHDFATILNKKTA